MVEDAMGTPGRLGSGRGKRAARAALYLAARDPAAVTAVRHPAGTARAPAASGNPAQNIEYSGLAQFDDSFKQATRIRVLPAFRAY